MKRWVAALMVALAGAVPPAWAEYVRIVYNFGAQPGQGGAQQGGGGGMPGMPGGGGGGMPGMPGGGGGGMPGMPGGGGGGMPGRPGSRSSADHQPNQGPGGGMPGMPGGGGGGMPGMPGGGGGMPGMPGGGGGGMPGMPGGGGGGPQKIQINVIDLRDWENKAEAIIEYSRSFRKPFRDPTRNLLPVELPAIRHKWGVTALTEAFPDLKVQFVLENGLPLLPVKARYKNKEKDLYRDGKTADKITELATWCLAHGLLDECAAALEDLVKASPSDPAAKAFAAFQGAREQTVRANPQTGFWKDRFGGTYRLRPTKHYDLLYNLQGEPPEVDAYASRLEENFRAYYYWFALRGVALPIPERRLVAVLVANPEEFESQRQVLDSPPVTNEGFFGLRDNIVVFSATRLDAPYKAVVAATKQLWSNGWSQERLLAGKGRADVTPYVNARNQMLALLLRAMQEESVRSAVSHNASIQLAVTTGLVPRAVEVPRWVLFAVGSYFETPKGAYWPGTGAPSWRYLVRFKGIKEIQERIDADREHVYMNRLMDPSEEALKLVVTDEYFRRLRNAPFLPFADQLIKIPGFRLIRNETTLIQAETMTWALGYFLAEKKLGLGEMENGQEPPGLLKYFKELNSLPRDLRFDEQTLLLTFCRGFNMVDPTDPSRINTNKFNGMAKEWYDFMKYTPLEAQEAFQDTAKELENRLYKAYGIKKPGSKKAPTR